MTRSATDAARTLADVVQDAEQGPEAIQSNGLRMVSAPRHLPVEVQHAALKRRLVGHFNYFGVNGNHRSMARVVHATERVWRKWLRRRSQRTRLTWERFGRLLERFPLPRPRVVVRIWGA